jgi:hypothetical protein
MPPPEPIPLGRGAKLKSFIVKHKVVLIVVLLVLAGIGWQVYAYQSRQSANARKEAEIQAAQAQQANTASQEQESSEFKDLSSKDFARPTCKRLENRKAIIITSPSCDYNIQATGEINMAIIVVYAKKRPDMGGTYLAGSPQNGDSINYINPYLKREAKRYSNDGAQINMKKFGPYKLTRGVSQYYYRTESEKIMDVYNETSKKNNVPEKDFDLIHFIHLDSTYGGIAMPDLHRAFTQTKEPGVFIHETLHLFGASDKYVEGKCNCMKNGTNDPFKRHHFRKGYDIMCESFDTGTSGTTNNNIINDITAREIGWDN